MLNGDKKNMEFDRIYLHRENAWTKTFVYKISYVFIYEEVYAL